MGDFAIDTAVEGEDGKYAAKISPEWEIWGPCGGYVAAIALRAAGAAGQLPRPASFFCHYLGTAAFDEVDISVETLRSGRTTESLRVSMTQKGKPVLESIVLAVREQDDALVHDESVAPAADDPDGLQSMAERLVEIDEDPPYKFWANVDSRPLMWHENWPPTEPEAPRWLQWERLITDATFDDPWLDAARAALWLDLAGWPAAARPHTWRAPPWVAVNVDLYAAFHRLSPSSDFVLVEAEAPIATDGLVGYGCKVWSRSRELLASGGGQLLCRPIPAVPNAGGA